MNPMHLTNNGPHDVHLSDGRTVKPGETVAIGPEITVRAAKTQATVIVLESP